jgi:hypothetical protein
MKRMSGVFELPVSSNDGNHLYETGSRWHVSQFYGAEKAQHAAHAINHVDALADALDALLSMLESEGRQGEEMFKDCERVSNSYWGIK